MLPLRVILILGSWFIYNIESLTNSTKDRKLHLNHTCGYDGDSVYNRSIRMDNRNFILDGKPFQVLSGSVHYFRMPSQYWRDRLHKLKAAGFNSVSTYVEWSYHEPEERQYHFKSDYDVAQFLRVAEQEKLYVLLRLGPYICAERDLGGFPYWLLSKYPRIRLRTEDTNFLRETRIWMKKLFEHLTPLLYENGGPIILIQIENEYGSYVKTPDNVYKLHLSNIIRQHVGTKALLFTTDMPQSVKIGSVGGALPTIDFGVGYKAKDAFKSLLNFIPSRPLMNSEFYTGWLTHWGEKLQQVSSSDVVLALKDMLEKAYNINMYMFFGGTNFEFRSGANFDKTYKAHITSYDYNAPLNESGDPTKKYYAIRNLLLKYNSHLKSIPAPTPAPKAAYGRVKVAPRINLMSSDGRLKMGKQYKDVVGTELPTFEKLRQRAGLMLYETTIRKPALNGSLKILKPRDRVYVYVDFKFIGCIDRSKNETQLIVTTQFDSMLSLLVENMGRINFGPYLHDFKGILSEVMYADKPLLGPWTVTGYPLDRVDIKIKYPTHTNVTSGPVLYEGHFFLPAGQKPLDTFLDTTSWGKGYVWVNGHNLGRYWPGVGPQITLYVPGVWLRKSPAPNTLHILELELVPYSPAMTFTRNPIIGCQTCYK